MKNPLLQSFATFAFILLSALSSQAQEVTGPYAKIALGVDYLDGYDFKSGNNNNDYIDATADFDIGNIAVLAGGYRFNESFALELEYAHRTHGIDTVSVINGDLLSSGDMKSSAIMVNAIYYITAFEYVNPYVGFGLGMQTDLEQEIEIANFGSTHSSDGQAFALQGLLGLEVPINREFRFFTEARIFSASSPDVSNSTSTYNVAYDSASLMFGLVYIFPIE